jgi:hypothetical protein
LESSDGINLKTILNNGNINYPMNAKNIVEMSLDIGNSKKFIFSIKQNSKFFSKLSEENSIIFLEYQIQHQRDDTNTTEKQLSVSFHCSMRFWICTWRSPL